jgi:transcriptional regulator with XRE-family HTH domain
MNEKYFVDLTKCGRNLIRRRRELLFGSQYSTSRAIGMNQSKISDWEIGRYKPLLSNFIKYLGCLKINPSFLDNSKLSNIVYFSPYEKEAPEARGTRTCIFQSLDRNVLLTRRGRELLKRKRLKLFGSQQNASLACGLDQSCISYWETGKIRPTLKRLMAYLKILRVPSSIFLNKYCSIGDERIIDKMIKAAGIANEKIIKRQGKFTPEKAYILGVSGPGDGYVGHDEIQLRVIDKEFADMFDYCLKKVYGLKSSRTIVKPDKPTFNKTYKVNLCSRAAVEDVRRYAKHFKEYNWQLPKIITNASENIKCAYLGGVFDSQAHVSVNKKEIVMYLSNLKGLYKIKELLGSIGIKSSVSVTRQILRISSRKNLELFATKINFVVNRKSKSLKKLLESYKK